MDSLVNTLINIGYVRLYITESFDLSYMTAIDVCSGKHFDWSKCCLIQTHVHQMFDRRLCGPVVKEKGL